MQSNTTKRNIMTRPPAVYDGLATLGVHEMAVIFRCSKATIRTISSRTPEKLPPAITIGRKKFWLQETVRAWLLEKEGGCAASGNNQDDQQGVPGESS